MRYGLLVLCIAVCTVLYHGWLARAYDHVSTAALSEEARLAIDLRCQNQVGRAARDCRALLKKLYLAGSLDPDKTLRFYCDSVKTGRWGGGRPKTPAVCVERYGAWPAG